MLLPSISVSRQALVRATCDGTGLITLPTLHGPEHFTCDGCRSCTPTTVPCADCGYAVYRTADGTWIDTDGSYECRGWGTPHHGEAPSQHQVRLRHFPFDVLPVVDDEEW